MVAQLATSSHASGSGARLAVPSADERLHIQSVVLAGLLRSRARRPERWRAPGFARQVELVRAHLRPIRSQESLTHSYAREHFHIEAIDSATPTARGLLLRSATEVAYALRWLELADGESRGPWRSILDAA